MQTATPENTDIDTRRALTAFEPPLARRALSQLATSFGGLFVACGLLYAGFAAGLWWAALLIIPAAGFIVRIFIIQHDCGHGSFLASRRANDLIGTLCGFFTLAPYALWRRHHAQHHANWCNLDRRESGLDIFSSILTVEEYRALPFWRRAIYRLAMHPIVANLLIPPAVFLLLYRVPFDTTKAWRRERLGVLLNNLGIAAILLSLGAALGFGQMAMVQLPIMAVAAIIGVWLFSIQHRFETGRWERSGNWSAQIAALRGSSYLKLNRVLRWFTGNIGLHHIHHLSPRVPNYRLQEAQDSIAALEAVPPLRLGKALAAWRFTLWDESAGRMTGFRAAR